MKLLDPSSEPVPTLDLQDLPAAMASGRTELNLLVDPDVDVSAVASAFDRIARIVVPFAVFRDGRGFSTAALLREAGFAGELRARGELLADQARMLSRCGFDAVELPAGAYLEEWTRSLGVVRLAYQPAQDAAAPIPQRRREAAGARGAAPAPQAAEIARLNASLRGASAEQVLETVLRRELPGQVAVLSSFGAEAAVSLHLVAQVDASTPVLFLDTDRHFAQTLSYRDQLVARLGLTDVRILRPAEMDARRSDVRGDLWRTNADLCCDIRKVRPLAQASQGFAALITGRKRFHGAQRMRLPVIEAINGQVRVNPLANWTIEQVEQYFAAHDLPRHPLLEGGFQSIGCWPCTKQTQDADVRSGRWAGTAKNECGIHLPSEWAARLDRAS